MLCSFNKNKIGFIFLILVFVIILLPACNAIITFFSFHPNNSYIIPQSEMPPDVEEVFFTTDDGVNIQALYFPHTSSKKVTIYFHGNSGNIYHRLNDYKKLHELGTSVFAVSYRGYAKSIGKPTEAGIYNDGKAAFHYVQKAIKPQPKDIFILGRSIGTTVAIDLAQNKTIGGLILISPLSNAPDQASAMGLGFAAPILENAFSNDTKIKNIKVPLLIIHGDQDKIIPIRFSQKLFKAANTIKFFHKIKGAGHNDLSNQFGAIFFSTISDFFNIVQNLK